MIDPRAVPDPMVEDEECARRTDNMLLPPDILIAAVRDLTDLVQVGSRHEARPAHFTRDLGGKLEKLEIEGEPGVDRRILVSVLRQVLPASGVVIGGRQGDVQEVMVSTGSSPRRLSKMTRVTGSASISAIADPGA